MFRGDTAESETSGRERIFDLPWEESEDMKEICVNFRIIERQRDLYRERCTRLQKENENLKRLLDKIQIVVCQYSNC